MKIAIVGAGGVGGYYGGLLARKGHTVCVLARTSNLAALKDGADCDPELAATFVAVVQAGDTESSGRDAPFRIPVTAAALFKRAHYSVPRIGHLGLD